MAKEMLINVSDGEETRIALVEDGHLEELYMERSSSTSHVGNIYKGKVTNVEASIQAAFIDFGLGRNGFLHITDLMPTYFGQKGEDIQETVGRKMARRDRPPIQRCLRRGDEIIVQIIKEGIGTKGPTLSSYLSIPGRILVMMPGMSRLGVSKKIEDDAERRRLRQILDGLKPPKDVGFIIRTAGVGKTKLEIQRDFTYLSRLWMQIDKKLQSGPGPMELYTEGDLVTRTVRDVFTPDVEQIVVDNEEVAKRVREVIKITAPRTKNKVELYTDPVPLFHKAGIEKDIEMMHSRHVPLPSGGSLVIDTTEAIVAIDVNSGKFRDHSDAETTAFKTDMEAADEIPRQLRLRNLGGVIICDFIDLRYERHRRELEERLHENFKHDRAKTKVLRMSQFGIIEITRSRSGASLKRSIYFDCPHCRGAGLVKTPESMSLDVMRRLAIAANDQRVVRIELSVCNDVMFYLQNRKRSSLAKLEEQTQRRIIIKGDPALALDEAKLELYDVRDGLVYLSELGMSPSDSQLGRGQGRHPQGRQDRNQQRGRGSRPPEPTHRREPAPAEDPFDFEEAEDAVEEREETRQDDAVAEDAVTEAAVTAPVQAERPESYSNFTDTDVDLGDEEDENDVQPMSNERPQPQGRYDNRGGQRRDGGRPDNRGGQQRRDDGRREHRGPTQRNDDRRDANRQGEPRRDEQRGDQRGDQRRGQQPQHGGRPQQGGQQQSQRPPQQQGGRPPQPQRGNRPPQQQGQRPPQQQGGRPMPQGQPVPQGQPGRGGNLPPGQLPGGDEQGGDFENVNGEGGPRRRRRRRRGGRGRNRNRQGQPGDQQNDSNDVPSANASFVGYDGPEGGDANAAETDEDRDEADQFDDQEASAQGQQSDRDADDRQDDRDQQGGFDPSERADAAAVSDQSDEREELPPPAEQPAEDAPPVGGLVEELNPPAEAEELDAAPKKPRSRGGSAKTPRGGKRAAKGAATPKAAKPAKEAAEPAAAEAKGVKSRRGATRGTTRGGRGKGRSTAEAPVEGAAKAEPAPTAPGPVVRTGSTDRHQLIVDEIADEPILTPEPRRPRTYRDLDEIPDDLD